MVVIGVMGRGAQKESGGGTWKRIRERVKKMEKAAGGR